MEYIGCAYKGCEDVVFGEQPFPYDLREANGLYPMQNWEMLLTSHFDAAGHRQRKLRTISFLRKECETEIW